MTARLSQSAALHYFGKGCFMIGLASFLNWPVEFDWTAASTEVTRLTLSGWKMLLLGPGLLCLSICLKKASSIALAEYVASAAMMVLLCPLFGLAQGLPSDLGGSSVLYASGLLLLIPSVSVFIGMMILGCAMNTHKGSVQPAIEDA